MSGGRSGIDAAGDTVARTAPIQATLALATTSRRRSSAACWFRQMMDRRTVLPGSLWVACAVPSR